MRHNLNNNFSYLLVALLIFLLGVPIAIDLHLLPDEIIRAISFSALLAIGLWSLRSSGRAFSAAVAFVVIGIVLNMLFALYKQQILQIVSMIAMLAFLFLATGTAMKQIATEDNISGNRIVGAICVYLMLGVIWALSYRLVEAAIPGSFGGLSEFTESASWSPDWVYFSFVTLTTLGYGDVLPLTYFARMLAIFESIVGQFYLAILVAGLVGAYLSGKQGQGQAPKS
jgi:voltage-gated potassium channel